MCLKLLFKPWYIYRPIQAFRSLIYRVKPPEGGYCSVQTSFGMSVVVNIKKAIGKSILYQGVFDLAVSEAILRLAHQGEIVVDVGANVGYMSILSSKAVGPHGKVFSFEPHPELFSVLNKNVDLATKTLGFKNIHPLQVALGRVAGVASLFQPDYFAFNDGVSKISLDKLHLGKSVEVNIKSIDEIFGSMTISLLKLDVEGFEWQVLQGAKQALSDHKIRNILFEEHAILDSPLVKMLKDNGYHIFSLGWVIRGLSIKPLEEISSLAKSYESPNYIATVEPQKILAQCKSRGWKVLSK